MFNRQNLRAAGVAASLALASAAHAAVDVSGATTEITDSKTAVLAIGLAVFGVSVGVKLYKWLKSAL